MLTRQLDADTLGVPSSEPRRSVVFAALGDGGGLPVWLRMAVWVLCASHLIGIVVGLVMGGVFLWVAAFGAVMIAVLALIAIQFANGSRPD